MLRTSSPDEQQLLELTTQSSGLTSQQVTTLASILAQFAGKQLNESFNLMGNVVVDSNDSLPTPRPNQQMASLFTEQQLDSISEDDELKLLHFPSKREDLSTAIPLTVIFSLLLVTGCVGNICTAIVIARPKNKYMHTATNYYLFSLAMSDFLFLILGLPQEMYTLWQRYPYAFGESFCIIRGYLSEASTYASILTISAFTVERYVAICHPLWAHTMSQLPRAITSIVIIWCLAAICAIPPAAELGIVTQRGPLTNRTLEQSAQCATKRTIYENMFVVSAIVFFIVPMIIVTVLYILIAIELRRSSRMNNAITKQTSSQIKNTTSSQQSTSNSSHPHHSHHSHHHSHHHHHLNNNHRHRHHCNKRHHKHLLHQPHQLIKPRSHQQLGAEQRSSAAADEKRRDAADRRLLGDLLISDRPQSAIGTEHAPAICCPLERAAAAAATSPAGSKTLNSSRNLHLPFASKLCHQLLGAGFWSGYNLTATSGDSCEEQGDELKERLVLELALDANSTTTTTTAHVGDGRRQSSNQDDHQAAGKLAAVQSDGKQKIGHLPLSRQHSPLSYHESLIQRNHPHSALDLSHSASNNCRQTERALACNGQHRPLLHAPPHHQLSLTQLPTNHHHNHHQRQFLLLNQHNSNNNNFKSLQASHHQNQQSSRRSNAASSKKSVIRMLVAVVVSFFICWVPFHAQRLLASYLVKNENENQNQLLLDIYLKLTYISGVMYYLSSTINPLLYQLMSAKFRLAFKETFKCSLFKCAIFRRSSSTATQPTAIGLNHSPTNSVRNTELSHSQLACPCQLSSARARFICDSGGRTAGGQKQQLAASSQTDLQQVATTDQPLNKHEQQQPVQEAPSGGGGGGGCCCCCCCQSHADGGPHQPHPWAPLTTSVLGRFRGQLNASLTSLFKFSLSDERSMKAGELPPVNCSCCLTSSPSLATPKRVLADDTGQKSAHGPLRRSETALVADDTEKCGQEADLDRSEEQMRTTLSQLQGGSALGGQAQGGRHQSACEPVQSETLNGNNLKAASLQTNFPSHHTMLKFVRSPTPSSLACGQPLTSLTRLSSRDDDDDEDEDDVEETTEMLNKQHLKVADVNFENCNPLPVGKNSMDALIRATKQEDDCIGHDESDPLISTTLTTSASSSNEASGTQSSVGSSPDQLGSTSQSTTNQARTLSNSSSRSSLAQLTSQNRDLRPSLAPVTPNPRIMAALSGVNSTRQKLIGSKSSAAETSASGGSQQRCRGHQLQRRASWRLDQMIDSDHQCEPTGRANTELVDSALNNNRVLIETQIIDQNGNERNESELIDRNCWPLPSSLSSSETKLNSNERKKTSQREPNKPTTKSSLSDDEDKPPSFSIIDSGSHSLDSNPTTRGDVANDQFEQDENLATAFMDLGPIGV